MADLTTKRIYTFGDSIYLLSEPGAWGVAQTEAQSFQGNLVTINNEAEQTFLAGLFAGQDLWTGYSDAGVEGNFQWINGENSSYTNWSGSEPNNNGDQDFTIMTNNGSWSDLAGAASFKGIIEIKNPANPILVIEDLGVIEPYGDSQQVLFKVKRFGNSNSAISVNYSTANGTGIAGTNYTATSGTLTFNPGETVKTIGVTVNRDADVTSGETFFVNLNSPTNAILGNNQAKATIREAPEAVTFGGSTYLVTNPGNWGETQQQALAFGGNLVTVNSAEEQTFLAGVYAGQDLWIGYSDAGKEYNSTTKEGFQWVNGTSPYTNWSGSEPNNNGEQDFTIMTNNGSWSDLAGSASFKGIIEIPSPLSIPLTDLTQRQIYTFEDSLYLLTDAAKNWGEAQVEAQNVQGNLVTISNEAEQTFLAGLFAGKDLWTGYSDAGVEGNFKWINGENSAYTNWSVSEPNNNGEQDFTIMTNNGSWSDLAGSASFNGIIEIKNPEIPILVIEDIGVIEPIGGTRQAIFTVRRYGGSNTSATVNYSTTDGTTLAGTDYTAMSGTLIFNPGEMEKTISVTVSPDVDVVSGETFFVNLNSPTNAILGDNQAKATIRENPEAVTFGDSTYLLTTEGNWGQVQQQARSFGGNLVTINSAEEQAFLAGKYAGQDLWIGYSDAGKEYNSTTKEGFQWVNGTSAYTNWSGSEPNNNGEQDFTIMTNNGSWSDLAGSASFKGIIEIPNSAIPATTPLSGTSTGTPVGVPIGTPGNDILTGTPGNTNLVGNDGNDILVCSSSKDTLTGGIGADRFLYSGNNQNAALQKSSVITLDRITDFNAVQGDRIWLDFDNNRDIVQLPKNLFNAKDVTGKTLTNAVKSAYADKNYKLRGKQALNAKEAVFFEWQNHTYLSVNDTRRQFTSSRDLVIDVTGIQMFTQDTVSGAIAVPKYFI